MSQYYYLDDSGDPGLDGDAGSTPCFVLAMVQTPTREPLPELKRLQEAFHLRSDFEFRYYRTTSAQKEAFFRAVQSVPFRVRAVALRKVGRLQQFTGMSGQDVTIELIAGLAMRASELDIGRDVLIIDAGTPAFRRALRIRLSFECRRLRRVPPFGKIIGAESRREDGLQLADMVAGAVRQHVMGTRSDYFRTLESKLVDLWELPARRQ